MDQPDQSKLLHDRVDTLYSNAFSANISVIVIAVLFLIVLRDSSVNQSWLLFWAASMSIVAIIRLVVWNTRKEKPDSRGEESWSNLYIWLTGALGCLWAISSFIVLQTESLFEIGLVYIVLFGVISAAIPVLSSMPLAFYAYIVPSTVTLGAIPWFDDHVPYFLSFAVMMFVGVSISTGRNLHRRIIQVFSLQYEKEDLEHEIRERQRAEKSLKFLAHHDVLTNLPNRLLLGARLKHAMENASRTRKSKVAVLCIDLDNFKYINDSLGHVIGDKLLQEVGSRMQDSIRNGDTLARLGGDEFIVVVEQLYNKNDISDFAQKMVDVINAPITIQGNDLRTSASIGIAVYPEDGDTPDELLKNSDAAMYKAKDSGRNNYQYYTEDLTASALGKIKLKNELIIAIENDQLEVFYQIQVCLTKREVVGVEALVRWRHPEQGILPPAVFFPIAEESGQMIKLGEIVLRKACTQMAKWKRDGIDVGKVAVNIAGVQVQSEELASTVEHICYTTGCKPEWLELEVTEDFFMKGTGQSIEMLQRLRDRGITIAIDDFGTGYSSLSYLKKLPVTKLKIDQSFIRDISTDPDDAAIVRAVIALAKSLNLDVVAEGIEHKHQEEFLLNEGCDTVQGFYYGKPVEASEIEALFNVLM